MPRWQTKIQEWRSPGKRVRRAGSQGECALIRDRRRWRHRFMRLHKSHKSMMAVILVVCCYRRDGRLVTEPGGSTKFSGLSVIEPE